MLFLASPGVDTYDLAISDITVATTPFSHKMPPTE
jgi:hypothetical protein